MPISEVFNEDNMIGMARFPDGYFDLAIVDPPYGISISHNIGRRHGGKPSAYKPAEWDSAPPPKEYFDQLFRISANQIIWGANHFISLMPKDSSCWIMWDKWISEDLSFSQFELAWTSFRGTCKKFTKAREQQSRIHPTQKPVALYRWILDRFGNGGGRIVDTHMGSQSSRIAAFNMGFDYWGWEIDTDHFEDGNKRFKEMTAQQQLFDNDPDFCMNGGEY